MFVISMSSITAATAAHDSWRAYGKQHGIRALAGRRFKLCITDSSYYLPIATHPLNQKFVAAASNHVWLADIIYIATSEAWLCFAAVLDLATRKIAGWSMREHMRIELTLAALITAGQRQKRPKAFVSISAAKAPRQQIASKPLY